MVRIMTPTQIACYLISARWRCEPLKQLKVQSAFDRPFECSPPRDWPPSA